MWRREEARIRDSLWNFAFNGLRVTGITFYRQSFLPRKGKEKLTLSLRAALEKDRVIDRVLSSGDFYHRAIS